MFGFLGLNLLDSVVTWFGIKTGVATEANWFGLLSLPLWATLSIKLALAGLIGFVVYKYRRKLFKPLNVGLGLVVAFNLLVLSGVIH
jgi:uncharacterized iron-regulated membrane protein